jgi:hypothetical protein
LQTSQGYIIHILQHFVTKLRNITNFVMLFQAVMKFLSRLVYIKILVIRLKVHWATEYTSWLFHHLEISNTSWITETPKILIIIWPCLKCMKWRFGDHNNWKLPPPPTHLKLPTPLSPTITEAPHVSLIKYINSLVCGLRFADVTLISIHGKSRKNRLVKITNSNWLSHADAFLFDQFYLVKTTRILVVLTNLLVVLTNKNWLN